MAYQSHFTLAMESSHGFGSITCHLRLLSDSVALRLPSFSGS
jgi:hypothetical protein